MFLLGSLLCFCLPFFVRFAHFCICVLYASPFWVSPVLTQLQMALTSCSIVVFSTFVLDCWSAVLRFDCGLHAKKMKVSEKRKVLFMGVAFLMQKI